MRSFLVWKNACLNYGGTSYMVFIGPVFHKTTKTCLKSVGHGGHEWVEKEMCRFADDMSKQTHCTGSVRKSMSLVAAQLPYQV